MLAFSPFGSRKTKSGLFTAVKGWGDYSKCKDIYLLSAGPGCSPDITALSVGSRLWVSDGFELEETTSKWEVFKDEPAFKELVETLDELDSTVKMVTVHEKALLAVG